MMILLNHTVESYYRSFFFFQKIETNLVSANFPFFDKLARVYMAQYL